jgi:hypothetical protein
MALAPWQHLRITLDRRGTHRSGFPTVLAVLLLGASLGLSACGAQEAGSAAIVNGTAISEHDVQTAAAQISTITQARVSPSDALFILMLAPYVSDQAKLANKSVSAADALKAIAKVAHPSAATIELARMQLALPGLNQAERTAVVSKLQEAKITVNPRYGTLDLKKVAIAATAPDWIKVSTPSPTP